MKKLLIILAIIFCLLLLSIALLQIDDELNPEAKKMVEEVKALSSNQSDAYLFLLGIDAPEGESPRVVGQYRLSEYQKEDQNDFYKIVEYPGEILEVIKSHAQDQLGVEKHDADNSALFCSLREEECFQAMFESNINIDSLIESNATLIFRVNNFLEFDEYATMTKPTLIERSASFHVISDIERIKVLKAISIHNRGDSKVALMHLTTQFNLLRESLKSQDTMIGKMVILMTLSEIIDVSSVIAHESGFKVHKVLSLSSDEQSFDKIVVREFAGSYFLNVSFDKNPNFFAKGNKPKGEVPGWVTRIVFKPNMTINNIVPSFVTLRHLAGLTPAEFINEFDDIKESKTKNSVLSFRNLIGKRLSKYTPDYSSYIARFSDFEAKLTLYNQLHYYQEDVNSISNPYYENEKPEILEKKICFRGPFEDERVRCLKTKI